MPEASTLVTLRRAPYGRLDGQEALDLALVMAAFDRPVSLALLGDGVYQLSRNQNSANIGLKTYTRAFAALGDFDIREVIIDLDALTARGLDPSQLQSLEHEDDDFNAHESLIFLQGKALADKLAGFAVHFGF